MAGERQVCTFRVGEDWFGLEVTRVREVVICQVSTRVPLAHPAVAGLINLRGQIVTAIDLRQRLGMSKTDSQASSVNIVVEARDGAISLIADEVGDVLTLSDQDFEPSPDTMREPARQLMQGIYKLPERLLVLLSSERLLGFS